MDDYIFIVVMLIGLPFSTGRILWTYRNRMKIKKRYEEDPASTMPLWSQYSRSSQGLLLGFMSLIYLVLINEIRSLFTLAMIYFLGALYILMFQPGFSYSPEEKASMKHFASVDDQNKLFLRATGIISLSFSICLFLIIGLNQIL